MPEMMGLAGRAFEEGKIAEDDALAILTAGPIDRAESFPAAIKWHLGGGWSLTLWEGGYEHGREWELAYVQS